MPEKSVSPLKNPPFEKSQDNHGINLPVLVKGVTGVRQGGEGDTEIVYALLRCRQCGKEQQVVSKDNSAPKWHRCVGCRELQPARGFALIAFANNPFS